MTEIDARNEKMIPQFEKEFLRIITMLEDNPKNATIRKYLIEWFNGWVNVINVRVHKDKYFCKDTGLPEHIYEDEIKRGMYRELQTKLAEVEPFELKWQEYLYKDYPIPLIDERGNIEYFCDLDLWYFRKVPKIL